MRSVRGQARAWTRLGTLTVLALITLDCLVATAAAGSWEMRVCADPHSPPFSSRDESGFENRIAEILADELGANLTYDWYPFGADTVNLRLAAGHCDLMMGVPDGYRDLLTTVAYYRSPYVFLFRSDAPFSIESFDDPQLRELSIGLQSVGIPPHQALSNRGLQENVIRHYGELRLTEGAAHVRRIVEDVANREIDVGIAWGPAAGFFAQRSDAGIEAVPVAPQVEPPFLPMSYAMTIAVRPGDHSYRDRLIAAMDDRWEEIQTVLDEFAVPRVPVPPPPTKTPDPEAGEVLTLALVTPTLTGAASTEASAFEPMGEAARRGAITAEGDVNELSVDFPARTQVLVASAPSPAAAARAFERLIATEPVSAFLGGIGEGQAALLSDLASSHRVPLINLTDPSSDLRRRCDELLLHVAPSEGMYADALARWFAAQGLDDWLILREEGPDGRELAERLEDAVESGRAGGAVREVISLPPGKPDYTPEIEAAQRAGVDVVSLLLEPTDQIVFLGQMDSLGADFQVAPFPFPTTQGREYIAAARDRSDAAGVSYRIVAWEATFTRGDAADLNDRFASRWGEPMDFASWGAYVGTLIWHRAAAATGSKEGERLVEWLLEAEEGLDLYKGVPLRFRPSTNQLLQPLFAIEIDPDSPWGPGAGSRTAIASLAGVLPHALYGAPSPSAREMLDDLGPPSSPIGPVSCSSAR